MEVHRWANTIQAETEPVEEIIEVIFASFMSKASEAELKRLRDREGHLCCALIDDYILTYVRDNPLKHHLNHGEFAMVMVRPTDGAIWGVPFEALEHKRTPARLITKTDIKQASLEDENVPCPDP